MQCLPTERQGHRSRKSIAARPFRNRRLRADLPPAITGPGVIAIGRGLEAVTVPAIGEALVAGGISAFELTLNEPADAALASMAELARRFSQTVLLVGAGTVLSVDAAARAVDAGAGFLVCPHVGPDVIRWSIERRVPIIPGGFTATEIHGAWARGATAVKVFPASLIGPAGLRELRGPLPSIPLIPTGGVTIDDAAAYIRAGAVAIGVGSWLIAGGDAPAVETRSRGLVAAIAEARAGR